MDVIINGKLQKMASPSRIIDVIDNENYQYLAARVNNRLRELNYIIAEDSNIELLDIKDSSAVRIYQSTLRYVVAMACKNIFPKGRISFNYSVSRSIFATVANLGHPFLEQNLNALKKEVDRIISLDLAISRYSVSKAEAIEYYKNIGQMDKVRILKYRSEDTVHMYECDNYKNYMFGYMLPSTGYLKTFELKLYAPGFLILYPRSECGGTIPQFQDEKTFRRSLRESNQWGNISKGAYISQMNEIVEDGKALEFINMCEARHNSQLNEIGRRISESIDSIRLICIAGPSSSGKTTFTNRVKIELKSRGIEPFMISMDDFYLNADMAPKDEFGKPDLEHIEALDLKLFDECIYKLILGEEVSLPFYDFMTKKRGWKEPVRITRRQPIMIEGIHGLNERIAPSVSDEQKFKIYIAPLAQYKIDDHNPISISDIRLIRRMVRDYQFRATGCEKTLSTWQSVRNGEFRWIYPYQNNADIVFNSELGYELCVMKKHAIPLLEEVPSDSPNFITANRLIKFLKYFETITDKWIPCNSILREFIGDSIFYTTDKK